MTGYLTKVYLLCLLYWKLKRYYLKTGRRTEFDNIGSLGFKTTLKQRYMETAALIIDSLVCSMVERGSPPILDRYGFHNRHSEAWRGNSSFNSGSWVFSKVERGSSPILNRCWYKTESIGNINTIHFKVLCTIYHQNLEHFIMCISLYSYLVEFSNILWYFNLSVLFSEIESF